MLCGGAKASRVASNSTMHVASLEGSELALALIAARQLVSLLNSRRACGVLSIVASTCKRVKRTACCVSKVAKRVACVESLHAGPQDAGQQRRCPTTAAP